MLPSPTDTEPTVFIIAADPVQRHDVVRSLHAASLRVEGFAAVAALLAARRPDDAGCILLDVDRPGLRGLDAQEMILRAGFEQPLILLTGFAEVSVAVCALQRGAFDLLQKPCTHAELVTCANEALAIDASRRSQTLERTAFRSRMDLLTPRERQVMARIVAGQANKVVARELGISEKTVETHRARVMEKLAVASLAELVRLETLHGPRERAAG